MVNDVGDDTANIGAGDSADRPPAALGGWFPGRRGLGSAGGRTNVREIVIRSPFRVGFFATIGVLLAIVLGEMIGSLSTVIVYVVSALFIALGLDPIVRWLERRHVRRVAGIAIVFTVFTLLLAGILSLVIPVIVVQITQLVTQAPSYLFDIGHQPWFRDLNARLGGAIDITQLSAAFDDFINDTGNITNIAGGVWKAGLGIISGVTSVIVVLILTLYFLASLKSIKRGFYAIVPRSSRAQTISLTEQITDSVGAYVIGIVVIAALNASLGFVAMTIIGVPYAGVVAVVVFCLATIPLIGSVTATVLVTLVGLLDSPGTALTIGIYYLVYMQIEAYVLTPRIMSRAVKVPGALVVIGAIAGGTLLGLLGALIAVPTTAAILMIVRQVVIPRQETR